MSDNSFADSEFVVGGKGGAEEECVRVYVSRKIISTQKAAAKSCPFLTMSSREAPRAKRHLVIEQQQ